MSENWQPRLVALDIDGTLLRWVDGVTSHEEITPAVRRAVARVLDSGAHVVLASGREADSMARIADLLELHREDADRLWVVASNGAVVLRYPPLEVVKEETFDARRVVEQILDRYPSALVAVEERGVGFRLNAPFPTGELAGDMIITPVEELVAKPVSRVIIRDPESTPEDFVALGRDLGLHGTSYVVGWTAWLDLLPVGVDKSSGLAHVCDHLGVDRRDVLAIGDGRNDIEMLQWAGRGVAMGQAVAPVLEAADAVTATVTDDGVAVELARWFGEGTAG